MKKTSVTLYVGTRKGAFIYRSDSARRKWTVEGPIMLGHIVTHIVPDPRAPKTIVMAARPGRIFRTMTIDEPQPRDESFRNSPRFAEYCRQLSAWLAEVSVG